MAADSGGRDSLEQAVIDAASRLVRMEGEMSRATEPCPLAVGGALCGCIFRELCTALAALEAREGGSAPADVRVEGGGAGVTPAVASQASPLAASSTATTL